MEPTLFQNGVDWTLFFSTFVLIFLAELPDKTAVAVLIMSSQRHPLGVYLGVCGAYLVQNIIAILAGSLLTLLPHRVVHAGAGILFLAFAVWMWFQKEEKGGKAKLNFGVHFWKTAWAAFVVIFIAEWGDLTQLATATRVATSGHPWTVFTASTLALWVASGMFVLIGHHSKKFIRPALLRKIAAVAFGVVGLLLLSRFWD
jgi:Ca2+/H+ antiporter, TMEM165/GDT1 family